jgi:methyl-accepting chemotaxis protein
MQNAQKNVRLTAEEQVESAQKLHEISVELKEMSGKLDDALSRFKI